MGKRSLLLVDSDARSLRVLEVSLRKAGFLVTTAVNGRDALDKARLARPDLILSDTDMPEMDGFELCRQLKLHGELARVPFVFLTGETAIESKIRGLELGVDEYLTKPIYIKEILTRIRILLQKQQRASLETRRDANTRFAGTLHDMGVVDLIQTIEVSRKSGLIHFSGPDSRQATIYFRNGVVIDAEMGHLQGADAVYRVLTWSDGEFELFFRTVRRKDAIEMATPGLLMEGMRRLDEWGRLLEQLPSMATRFEVDVAELADRLAELPDELNNILRLFDGRRSLLDVIDLAGVGDLECIELVSRLYFEGLLHEVEAAAADTAAEVSAEAALEGWLGRPIAPADRLPALQPAPGEIAADAEAEWEAGEAESASDMVWPSRPPAAGSSAPARSSWSWDPPDEARRAPATPLAQVTDAMAPVEPDLVERDVDEQAWTSPPGDPDGQSLASPDAGAETPGNAATAAEQDAAPEPSRGLVARPEEAVAAGVDDGAPLDGAGDGWVAGTAEAAGPEASRHAQAVGAAESSAETAAALSAAPSAASSPEPSPEPSLEPSPEPSAEPSLESSAASSPETAADTSADTSADTPSLETSAPSDPGARPPLDVDGTSEPSELRGAGMRPQTDEPHEPEAPQVVLTPDTVGPPAASETEGPGDSPDSPIALHIETPAAAAASAAEAPAAAAAGGASAADESDPDVDGMAGGADAPPTRDTDEYAGPLVLHAPADGDVPAAPPVDHDVESSATRPEPRANGEAALVADGPDVEELATPRLALVEQRLGPDGELRDPDDDDELEETPTPRLSLVVDDRLEGADVVSAIPARSSDEPDFEDAPTPRLALVLGDGSRLGGGGAQGARDTEEFLPPDDDEETPPSGRVPVLFGAVPRPPPAEQTENGVAVGRVHIVRRRTPSQGDADDGSPEAGAEGARAAGPDDGAAGALPAHDTGAAGADHTESAGSATSGSSTSASSASDPAPLPPPPRPAEGTPPPVMSLAGSSGDEPSEQIMEAEFGPGAIADFDTSDLTPLPTPEPFGDERSNPRIKSSRGAEVAMVSGEFGSPTPPQRASGSESGPDIIALSRRRGDRPSARPGDASADGGRSPAPGGSGNGRLRSVELDQELSAAAEVVELVPLRPRVVTPLALAAITETRDGPGRSPRRSSPPPLEAKLAGSPTGGTSLRRPPTRVSAMLRVAAGRAFARTLTGTVVAAVLVGAGFGLLFWWFGARGDDPAQPPEEAAAKSADEPRTPIASGAGEDAPAPPPPPAAGSTSAPAPPRKPGEPASPAAASAESVVPTSYEQLYEDAKRARRRRDYGEVIALAGRALRHRETAQALTLQAEAISALGDPRRALSIAERATELRPRFSSAWYIKGRIHRTLGERDSARAAFERYLDLDPEGNRADQVLDLLQDM